MTTKLTPEHRMDCLRLAADDGTHHMDDNQRDLLLQIMCIELGEVSSALSVLVGHLDDSTDVFTEASSCHNRLIVRPSGYPTHISTRGGPS